MSKRILIRIPNWLGDAVMATAAIRAYHEQSPGDRITLIGPPHILTVFSSSYNPYNLFPYDKKGKDAGIQGLLQLSEMLRDEYYDIGYLLTNSFSSALMFYMGKIPERIGYATQFRSLLLTDAVKPVATIMHQAEKYAYLFNRDEGTLPDPHIRISPEEREKARQVLEEKECLGRLRIGMAVGAAYGPAKQWPADRFAELARECVKTLGARVLLFGAKTEIDLVLKIQNLAGEGVVNLAGQTTLRQLLALLQQCRVVVANDSGVMHAATAVQTPVAAIFGSTDPVQTGPLGKHFRILYEDLDCSPCFDRVCRLKHYNCLKRITPQHVLTQIEELLELKKEED